MELISKITGQAYNPLWSEKLPFIIQGIVGALVLFAVGSFAYWYWFKKESWAKGMFFWPVIILGMALVGKYVLYHFAQGYVPDRWIMYALPSPRIGSLTFFGLSIITVIIFLRYRSKINAWKNPYFILAVVGFMMVFSLSVAGIREGTKSIIDPLTRSYWEYTGTLPTVHSLGGKNFLHQYTELLPELPIHTQTHPPGYVLFLYGAEVFLQANYLGMAVLIVLFGSLSLIPLFFFWEKVFSPTLARRLAELFVFVPSIIIFSSTSLEIFFLFLVSAVLHSAYRGWKGSYVWSILCGLFMTLALFSNFLFLLTGPIWLACLVFFVKKEKSVPAKWLVLGRVCLTGVTTLALLGILYLGTGYSIIDNFLAARSLNQEIVQSNFASMATYINYFLMNLVAFALYLGVPALYIFIKNYRHSFDRTDFWHWLAASILFFFLLIGIFQGENERIWLFIVPFVMVYLLKFASQASHKEMNAFLALQAWQIITIQILFYTYW